MLKLAIISLENDENVPIPRFSSKDSSSKLKYCKTFLSDERGQISGCLSTTEQSLIRTTFFGNSILSLGLTSINVVFPSSSYLNSINNDKRIHKITN